jgi:hypothetical protein
MGSSRCRLSGRSDPAAGMSVNTVGEIAARISMLQPKRSLSTADARNLEERSMARATKKPEEVGRFNVTRERIRQIEESMAREEHPSIRERMSEVHTLAEIAARTTMLTVACSRRERRGRYRLDNLIARHGDDAGVRIIVPELTADCPQRELAALMERCDILFPDLPALFRLASPP